MMNALLVEKAEYLARAHKAEARVAELEKLAANQVEYIRQLEKDYASKCADLRNRDANTRDMRAMLTQFERARVAELQAALSEAISRNGDESVYDDLHQRFGHLLAVPTAPSVSKPLPGAELADKYGFEPIPDHRKDPFVRPMRIMVGGFAPNGQEPNNHAVDIESSSAPATPAKGCADPATPAIGAPPEGEVTATAASKLGSRDGGERPAFSHCSFCDLKSDYGCPRHPSEDEQRPAEATHEAGPPQGICKNCGDYHTCPFPYGNPRTSEPRTMGGSWGVIDPHKRQRLNEASTHKEVQAKLAAGKCKACDGSGWARTANDTLVAESITPTHAVAPEVQSHSNEACPRCGEVGGGRCYWCTKAGLNKVFRTDNPVHPSISAHGEKVYVRHSGDASALERMLEMERHEGWLTGLGLAAGIVRGKGLEETAQQIDDVGKHCPGEPARTETPLVEVPKTGQYVRVCNGPHTGADGRLDYATPDGKRCLVDFGGGRKGGLTWVTTEWLAGQGGPLEIGVRS